MGYSKFEKLEFSRFSDFRIVNIKIIKRVIQNFDPNFEIFEFQNYKLK